MIVRFTTEWFGLAELAKEELAALRRPVEIAITKATLYYEGRVKLKLNAVPARHGRIYIIDGKPHQASAPGEPPAPLTTDLRRSIAHTPVSWAGDEASAEVGTSDPKARRLELGGVDKRGIRILPRPYFGATWIEEEANIQAILDEAVSNAPVLADIIPTVAP